MNAFPQLALPSTSILGSYRTAWPRMVAAFESRWVAYSLILILQLKVIWAMWAYRELTGGDTAGYFTLAWHWFTAGEVNLAWSPLYTAFFGNFMFLSSDPVWITSAHRLTIVLAAAILVLAVLRYLLPPAIAWFCAAWWAVLPIAFDTMYEVHLFAVLPILTVWLLLLSARGPWRRASALATLAVSAALVRNELSVATGVLAICLAAFEWKASRKTPDGSRVYLLRSLAAYAVCLASAAGIVGLAYERSYVKGAELNEVARLKHTINMGQVYAFGFQQRHPEWTSNPWLDYSLLMQEHFGSPEPTFADMIAANPRAVAEHVLWNMSLAPSGLQLLLFNRASGTISPDYDGDVPRRLHDPRVGILSGCLLAVWGLGLISLWRNRTQWWKEWLSARLLGWVGMLAIAAVVPLVIATQRPRPSYLLAFGIALIAFSGMCSYAILVRWRAMQIVRQLAPVAMVLLILFVPRFFTRAYAASHPEVIAKATHRLVAFREEIVRPEANLVVPRQPVGMYVNPTIRFLRGGDQFTREAENCESPKTAFRGVLYELPWLINRRKVNETIPALLHRYAIDFIYLDEESLALFEALPAGSGIEAFVRGEDAVGSTLIASGSATGDRWRLYRLKN